MKNFSTWLLVMFMAMFWVLRIIVSVTYEFGIDFGGIKPLDMNAEVILLFVALICLIFIVNRKIIGVLIYLLTYGIYFGVDLFGNIMTIISDSSALDASLNAFVSVIGLVLPIAVLIDLLLDRNRKANPVDNKTDWYYQNEEYDRNLDERADKNNYRTL